MRKEKWIKTVTLSAAMLGVFAFSLSTAACIGGDDSGSGSICGDPVTYSVLFYDYDGRVLDEQTVEEGEVPVYGGETPVRATAEGIEYSFEGWKQDGVLLLSLPAITANTEFTASYTADPIEYKVTFVVGGDSITEDYHWGETPSYKGE
ncbi:MAG: hypothetical protein IJY38_03075 [Clostridia bacterium]|nr:hypothetical protein [Clostridia bacterium]